MTLKRSHYEIQFFRGYTLPVQKELSHRLFERGKLMTRSGLHCSPGSHQMITSYPLGTTRFSFGYFNTPAEIEKAIQVLNDLAKNPTVAIR